MTKLAQLRCCAGPISLWSTFTENLLTYSMGRTHDYYDMPTVRKIVRDTAAKGEFTAIFEPSLPT